jgi:membrane-bound lytic murein transglycosylase
MKKLLAAMFVALLMIGWVVDEKQPTTLTNQTSRQTHTEKTFQVEGVSLEDNENSNKIIAEAIDDVKLQQKGKEGEELRYASNQQTPYTGWAKLMYDNGQMKWFFQYKDGKYVEEKEAPAPNSCADSTIVNPPKH